MITMGLGFLWCSLFALLYTRVDCNITTKLNMEGKFTGLGDGSITSIQFDPRVYPNYHDNQYSDDDIYELLQLVSSRFSTISVNSEIIHHYHDFIGLNHYVAKMNKANKNNPSFRQVDMIINIVTSSKWNVSLEFELTRKVAKWQNNLLPGTVTTIAINKFETKDSPSRASWDDFKAILGMRFRKRIENDNSLSIAAYVDVAQCNAFEAEFNSVSEWVQVVIVDISRSSSVNDEPLVCILYKLLAEWKLCKDSFKYAYYRVKVMLAVACSRFADAGGNTSIENVANCWDIIYHWARDNDVFVVLSQAFETPGDPLGGWWRMKPDIKNHLNATSFDETFKPVMENESVSITPADVETTCKVTGPVTNMVIILVSCFIVMAHGLFVCFLIYSCRRKTEIEYETIVMSNL